MLSIEEKQIEQLLTDLVEMDVVAVSAERRLAQRGDLLLTIYPSESEVEEMVEDYLATVDLVWVNERLASLRYDQTYFGLDFLGEVPLFVNDDVEFYHPESGELNQGYEIEQGLSQLYSTFEPKTKEELEEQLFTSQDLEGVQL